MLRPRSEWTAAARLLLERVGWLSRNFSTPDSEAERAWVGVGEGGLPRTVSAEKTTRGGSSGNTSTADVSEARLI